LVKGILETYALKPIKKVPKMQEIIITGFCFIY